MADSSNETSPAPSASGLKGVLAKAQRGLRDNNSATSLNGPDGGSKRGGIRSSVDSAMEKLKSRTNGEPGNDNGNPAASNKISKFLPKTMRKKREKRAADTVEQQEAEETGRGRSIGDRSALSLTVTSPTLGRSQDDLTGDGEESIMTEDSENESPARSPPPLLQSRESHTGYLTSSSPLLKASFTQSEETGGHPANAPSLKSTTFPVLGSATTSTTNLAPRHATTLESPGGGPPSRSISPGTRIKDVFNRGSRDKGATPPVSPGVASVKPMENGNQGGELLLGENNSSFSLRRASKSSEVHPVLSQPTQLALDRQDPSKRNVASLSNLPKTPISASLQTPSMEVTPPTPVDRSPVSPDTPPKVEKAPSLNDAPNTVTSASGNMISHRRVRSDSATYPPSKLSQSTTAPLTPMPEETRTPSGRLASSGGSPAGFFSSVFSAAQSAANTISNSIGNNQIRTRSGTQTSEEEEKKELVPATETVEDLRPPQQKQLAIDTLGNGDLSLSHLGIDDPPGTASSNHFSPLINGTPDRSKGTPSILRDEVAAQAEETSSARAVSAAYSEKPQDETSTPTVEDTERRGKPGSLYEPSIAASGDKTPPGGSMFEGKAGFKRSGSVRSRVPTLGRKHRNSSAATGSTIAAGLMAGHAALANPATGPSKGFAVAPMKRNRDFHQLFRSVPEDDYLIEDYSAALQREIILAGRLYISEGHICFSSNILGWVTTLIISFDEVVSMEKEMTALIIPNAITVQTLHARHTFRSLLTREATYDMLVGIWKIRHPSLKSSLNGVHLEAGTGDKTEKMEQEPSGSDDGSDGSEDDGEASDDDDDNDEDDTGSVAGVVDGRPVSSDGPEAVSKTVARKVSAIGLAAGNAAGSAPTVQSDAKLAEKAGAANAASADFPGPTAHAPTECSDGSLHYDKVLKDEVVQAPLGKIYSMIFGPASSGFLSKWLLDEVKVLNLEMTDDKKGLSDEVRTRSFSYIKPLNASIGPKQTKCIITESVDTLDLEKAVSVTVSTQTPDVPSGNVFTVKAKYCLTWAPGNATRLFINCTVEWTGKSWLKGPIEKGANDGQQQYADDLIKALNKAISSRPRAGTVGSKQKPKKGRKKANGDATIKASETKPNTASAQKSEDWGLFEPLHGVFGPIFDMLSPLVSANVVIGVLLSLLLLSWWRGSGTSSAGRVGFVGITPPERIAAYEELWRREESDLWDWLEERIGMDGISYPVRSDHESADAVANARAQRQKALKGGVTRAKLVEEAMSEREVDAAIRVTSERLGALQDIVQRQKAAKSETTSQAASEPKGQ